MSRLRPKRLPWVELLAVVERAQAKPSSSAFGVEIADYRDVPGVSVLDRVRNGLAHDEDDVSLHAGGDYLRQRRKVDVDPDRSALRHARGKAPELGVDPSFSSKNDIHVHVPAGATPKDGPSAGITMLSALTSAFTQRKVKGQLAMTGEITLRGRVLPVGGVKEKILAAQRNGVTDLILSVDNEHDIKDIKEDYIDGLKFHYVENMMEVLDLALEKEQDVNDLDYNKYLNNLHPEVIGFKVK